MPRTSSSDQESLRSPSLRPGLYSTPQPATALPRIFADLPSHSHTVSTSNTTIVPEGIDADTAALSPQPEGQQFRSGFSRPLDALHTRSELALPGTTQRRPEPSQVAPQSEAPVAQPKPATDPQQPAHKRTINDILLWRQRVATEIEEEEDEEGDDDKEKDRVDTNSLVVAQSSISRSTDALPLTRPLARPMARPATNVSTHSRPRPLSYPQLQAQIATPNTTTPSTLADLAAGAMASRATAAALSTAKEKDDEAGINLRKGSIRRPNFDDDSPFLIRTKKLVDPDQVQDQDPVTYESIDQEQTRPNLLDQIEPGLRNEPGLNELTPCRPRMTGAMNDLYWQQALNGPTSNRFNELLRLHEDRERKEQAAQRGEGSADQIQDGVYSSTDNLNEDGQGSVQDGARERGEASTKKRSLVSILDSSEANHPAGSLLNRWKFAMMFRHPKMKPPTPENEIDPVETSNAENNSSSNVDGDDDDDDDIMMTMDGYFTPKRRKSEYSRQLMETPPPPSIRSTGEREREEENTLEEEEEEEEEEVVDPQFTRDSGLVEELDEEGEEELPMLGRIPLTPTGQYNMSEYWTPPRMSASRNSPPGAPLVFSPL
ncbi:hypothetical protein BGW38_004647 [Lunasporangiospora selenospora]|uniref:Uncharacterized protein n=1 Tax=Lunasporangiospora selenospora TaxID=979761 RepID=A0A9P6KBZ9_9FUNG|nr:hypothetical protein BGW38_004647 [Lunasporangiospora selenospora]